MEVRGAFYFTDAIALKLKTQLKARLPSGDSLRSVFAKISARVLSGLAHIFCVLTLAIHVQACKKAALWRKEIKTRAA
jgi:hypothetical protein